MSGGELTGIGAWPRGTSCIPVADTWPPPRNAIADGVAPARRSGSGPLTVRQALMLVALLLVGWSYMQVLATGGTLLFALGVAIRYALTPMIALALALHLQRHGPSGLLGDIGLVLPFLAIGILSGIVNDNPIDAARSLVFWTLGVVAAAVIGEEMPPARLMRTLFWLFFGFAALSAAMAIAVPHIGRQPDLVGDGFGTSWRGVTPNKNQFASFLIYALLFGVFAPRIWFPARAAMIGLTLVNLVLSKSGGGVVQLAALCVFIAIAWLLRKIPLSRPLRSVIFAFTLVSGAGAALVLRTTLLELLGKNATLTGRAEVWPAYFNRALEHWLIGTGPGTFTQLSLVTVDIGASMADLGSIHTPHDMYIAAFGEVGLFGLIAFVAIFLYTAFVQVFRRRSSIGLVAGGVAMASIVGGISETREVFGTGMGMFLLVLCSVSARRDDRERSAETARSGGIRAPHREEVGAGPVVLGG